MTQEPLPLDRDRGKRRVPAARAPQSIRRVLRSIGLPVWILIGAAAGVVAGIVFGERTEVLQPIGSAYAMMLQVAVYPYLLCSLLYGVGRLTPTMARRLLSASWAVYLLMWLATFATIWVIACAPSVADGIDGAIWTLEQASAWAAAHPGFTAVRPANTGGPILIAYLMPPGADGWRQYLDQWLELKTSDGFRDAQIDYWIKGKPRAEQKPRWNLLDALMSGSSR